MKRVIRFARKIQERTIAKKTQCNICSRSFRAKSRFDRFCRGCKESHELYRFSGWFRGGAHA